MINWIKLLKIKQQKYVVEVALIRLIKLISRKKKIK